MNPYTPKFTYEVVAIKKSLSLDSLAAGTSDLPHSGELSAIHQPVEVLIQDAYGVDSANISGGPAWIGSDLFDVQAKSSSSVNTQLSSFDDDAARFEKKNMLQALLSEKFSLKVHWVTKEMPAYALVVLKGGPKIKESQPNSSYALGSGDASDINASQIQIFPSISGHQLVARGLSTSSLVSVLGHEMNTTVLDHTGLGGNYDFTLEFLPEGREDNSDAWPRVFVAVEDQLGLKLEPTITSISILVIDSIKQPTSN
ncbi:MAG TPA: TIGR03435 family protein [Terriglobales bacterium]|nr:TIGR03435 family protein [Terriglobales bacterium]